MRNSLCVSGFICAVSDGSGALDAKEGISDLDFEGEEESFAEVNARAILCRQQLMRCRTTSFLPFEEDEAEHIAANRDLLAAHFCPDPGQHVYAMATDLHVRKVTLGDTITASQNTRQKTDALHFATQFVGKRYLDITESLPYEDLQYRTAVIRTSDEWKIADRQRMNPQVALKVFHFGWMCLVWHIASGCRARRYSRVAPSAPVFRIEIDGHHIPFLTHVGDLGRVSRACGLGRMKFGSRRGPIGLVTCPQTRKRTCWMMSRQQFTERAWEFCFTLLTMCLRPSSAFGCSRSTWHPYGWQYDWLKSASYQCIMNHV